MLKLIPVAAKKESVQECRKYIQEDRRCDRMYVQEKWLTWIIENFTPAQEKTDWGLQEGYE